MKNYNNLKFLKEIKIVRLIFHKNLKRKKINHLLPSKIIEKINKLFIQNENEKISIYRS